MDRRSTRTATFPTYSITPACNCSRVRGCSEVISLYSADLIYPIDGRKKKTERGYGGLCISIGRSNAEAEIWPKSASPRIMGHLVDDRHDRYSGRKSPMEKDERGRGGRSLFSADHETKSSPCHCSYEGQLLFGFCHNVSHCVRVTRSSC